MKRRVLVTAIATLITTFSAHANSEIQELRSIVEAQQDQLDQMSSQLSGSSSGGFGGVNIGGYGELHYNNLSNKKDGGSDKTEVDFHRFVLYFSKDLSENIHFFSEFELEHSIAGEGQVGEIELEQAFIDVDLNEQHTARGGLFLVPVGILNETHEPPTFYGTERNPVEKNIIPTTWWEAGAALYGELAPGLSYDAAIHSGLNNSDYKIRSGRQKVGEAKATDLAFTGRIKWTAIPGLEIAATLQQQQNITQGTDPDASATLVETHAVYQNGPVGIRALYATWDINGDGAKAVGMDEQSGYYLEPSFRISENIGIFARYNQWDNAAGDNTDSEYTQVDAGINYWLHSQVVVKLDYQNQSAPEGKDEYDGFNLGLGYNF